MVQNRTKKKIGDKNEDHMNFSPWLVHETERFWCSICGEILVFYLWRDSCVLICREILVFYLWRDSGVLSVEIFWCSICGEILVLVFYLWRDSGVLSVERFWWHQTLWWCQTKMQEKVHGKSVGDAENMYNQYQIKAAFNHHFCCCGSWSFHLFQALKELLLIWIWEG